jgi:hypothetical protein
METRKPNLSLVTSDSVMIAAAPRLLKAAEKSKRRVATGDAKLIDLVEQFLISEKQQELATDVVNKMEESFFGINGKKAPRGYEKAKRAAEAFGNRSRKMEERIIATPAKTFDGLVAKARALECNLVDGESVEDGTDSDFKASFVKDILRMKAR